MSDERPEDVAGDAGEDDTVSMPAIEAESLPEARTRSRGSLIALIALVASLAAFAGSGVLLWQYRQFYVSLADADSEAQAALERVRAAAAAADNELERLADALEDNARELRELDDEVEGFPGQFADLQRRIDAIQGGSFDARSQWLEAEAAYYLGVANSELQLGGRWDNALTALRLADDRLRATGDPGLAGVREQLAEEILALESVRLLDIEGLAHSLARLSQRVTGLPVRSAGQRPGDDTGDTAAAEPGLGRLWSSVKNAFASIVTVERSDEQALAALSLEEERLIRRQLGVELQTARVALLARQPEVFRASLEQAVNLLQSDFATGAAEVEGALRLIESLLELNIAPTPPDISRSLYALRARGEQ